MIALLAGLCIGLQTRTTLQESMDPATAKKTRYRGDVGIWYGSHFEDTAEHDWVPIKEWNGPFHPVLGDYKTDDRAVLTKHLEWLRRAGVDVIFYDVCRVQPEPTLYDLSKQRTLRMLVDALSHQERESRKLKLVLWLEKWNGNPTVEQYRFGLDYILKNLAVKNFYYRLDGKPLVIRYLNDPAPDFSSVDTEYGSRLSIRRISPSNDGAAWGYFYSPEASSECMTVNPGADGYMEMAFINGTLNHRPIDAGALRSHGKEVAEARRDGRLMQEELLRARAVDPKMIFISGWNDWAFCMQIEPAKEYGFKYVDLCAKLLGRSDETASYRRSP